MSTFTGFDANQAIVDFFGWHAPQLPAEHRSFILNVIAGRDLLRAVIVTMETLYAARSHESFPTAGADLMGNLARFVEVSDFYGLGDRARSIITVSERILAGGEATVEGDVDQSELYAPKIEPVD